MCASLINCSVFVVTMMNIISDWCWTIITIYFPLYRTYVWLHQAQLNCGTSFWLVFTESKSIAVCT